jgi:hypothetical protein
MPPVVIENPILNSPYVEPTRHFRFDAKNEITNNIDPGRRGSSYFLPIAAPKKKTKPGLFDDAEVEEKKAESGHVNDIRRLVKKWRFEQWPDVTPVTRALLDYWHSEDRFRRLFFCQIEVLEWGGANLWTQFGRIVRRAGVEPWPRLWHSLRASCESDLAQSFPLATVTKWLGNTPSVALRHYVDPTEAAFDRAANWIPATESGAKSGAREARNEAQVVDASSRSKSQMGGGNAKNANAFAAFGDNMPVPAIY